MHSGFMRQMSVASLPTSQICSVHSEAKREDLACLGYSGMEISVGLG